ncbi:MAG: anaerobic ribonucleoside-triphosphate reductase activating protein [Muribaculaceae bacterium]|nr:anaerobic ribonucleoside-triphosphate reductase activating protein [Muribaculaceae bacterium]
MFRVADIIRGTTVDGQGFRTSIYLSGCSHHCEGCHNPATWNPDYGEIMSLDDIMDIVREEDFNVTLSGGDPLFNPEMTGLLINALKNDGRTVWVYTGFTWEEIINDVSLLRVIKEADVVVDGRFVKELMDPDLPFRGSLNQRLIDVKESLEKQRIVEYSSRL